jgi:ABC-type antimicrobial peptide transport system permease subunit
LADKEEPILPVYVDTKEGSRWMDCKVVGTLDAPDDFSNTLNISESVNGTLSASIYIVTFMSQATMDEMTKGAETDFVMRFVIYNTSNPAYVIEAAEQVGMICFNVYTKKSEAMREMQIHAQTKMIIVLLMFVLLGINLYGSFSNALDRRRFEVGIKRAIGASKAAIIGQFMWESLLLMIINTFISVVLVFNGFLAYKYYWEADRDFNPYWKWTIYMNGTSMAMFVIVTLSLTVLFSVIFAIKATQVQVVEYLKAE